MLEHPEYLGEAATIGAIPEIVWDGRATNWLRKGKRVVNDGPFLGDEVGAEVVVTDGYEVASTAPSEEVFPLRPFITALGPSLLQILPVASIVRIATRYEDPNGVVRVVHTNEVRRAGTGPGERGKVESEDEDEGSGMDV